jgi:hopanoid biosynthesis associated RND transporter like protein HpnN
MVWNHTRQAEDMMSEPVPAEEVSRVRRLLLGLVTTACRFPRLVLAVSLLLCGLSALAACTCLRYQTQRNDLMSPHKDHQQRWRKYLAEFGDDDDIVVVVKGTNRAHMEQALEALAARVRQQPEHFDRLFYKVDLRALHNRALLFLSTEEIRTIRQNLEGMRLLLEFGPLSWSGLTLSQLFQEAGNRAARMKPGKKLSTDDDQFFTQLLHISRTARAVLADPDVYANPWSSLMARAPEQKDLLAEPQYFFSAEKHADGQPYENILAFLLVRPLKEKDSFTAALQSVTAMRGIVADTRPAFPDVEFGLTGLPVLESDEMAAADRDTRRASLLAIAGVMLLFLLVYRGIFYPLLTVVTLLVGTAWAMGWMTLTVGHLNILSATFAVMLIGMGDYGVLWVMRYEQARRQGVVVTDALRHTTTHVAIGNLTAASTLALAFFAAMFADFRAVAELGWIAGCGVLLCALACFTVLPALLVLFDRRRFDCGLRIADCGLNLSSNPQSAIRNPQSVAEWLPFLGRRPGWILGAGAVLTVFLAVCAGRVQYDHNLLHLQASNLDAVKWEMTLIEHTAGASWHALSYVATPEEARTLRARYERLPEVSRVVEVASLVPADQDAKMKLMRDIQTRLRRLPKRGAVIPHIRPDSKALEEEVTLLAKRLQPLSAAAPAVAAGKLNLRQLQGSLKQLETELAEMPVRRVGEERLQDFEQRLAGDLAEDLHRLREVATPQPIQLSDLPPDLRERYVGKSGKWLLRVFAKDCLWEFEPLRHFTEQIRAIDPEATGKPFGTVEGLQAMKNGLTRAGIYAFVVIVAVLLIDFRSTKRTLVAVAPLILSVLMSVGILGLFGVPLNPANVIAFPLILGVGVDNGVHILHDYLLRRREGQGTISRAMGRGVLVKALTTMIGFGTLMIATERGLVGLGLILTLGVGCSMLTALFLLPAALHLYGQRVPAPAPEPAAEPAAEPEPYRVAA